MQAADAIPNPSRQRLPIIDAARGVAILAMIVFHTAWDMDMLGLAQLEVGSSPYWRTFSRSIAASFLFLVGVGLTLAHQQGMRWAGFGKRLAMVTGGAALVTLGTWVAFPDAFVYFGILHIIAVASVLALPFVFLPAWLTLLAAALALSLPFLPGIPRIEGPWFWWLGLAEDFPRSVDYIPVLPWIAAVLAGIAVTKATGRSIECLDWQPRGRGGQALVTAGRWSLPIYLVHQPILFGTLWLVARVLVSPDALPAREFAIGCERVCVQSGMTSENCASACTCAADALKRDGLWPDVLANRLDEAQTRRMNQLAGQCLRR